MKSLLIKQLIENNMRQENLNNNDQSIKKLPTQSNQMKKKIKYQNEKNIKNPSITRRKPRVYVPNRKYFDPNRRKLKSFSRSKKNNNNKIYKFKFLITNKKTNHMNNRTICTDGYDNMIISSNAHDRNLSAPSLNYQINEDLYTNYLKKKKKNNIIKFNRLNKKINENLINRDNYTNPIELNFNSVKENNTNITVNDDKISYITYNNNNDIHQINLDKSKIKGDLSSSVKVRSNNDHSLEDKYNNSSKGTACKSSTKSSDKDSTAYTDKTYAEVCDPDGWTNVRARPTVKSDILNRIDNGEKIEVSIVFVNGKQSNWYFVPRYNGYVYKSKIKIVH